MVIDPVLTLTKASSGCILRQKLHKSVSSPDHRVTPAMLGRPCLGVVSQSGGQGSHARRLYVAPVWFGLLIVAYRLIGPRARPALGLS
ncbi:MULTISPECIES: hypothetical protein [Inquilinus]|uniref:Uncharacterized protein n=1 Tax=Inquilinus ginsengisoli TaxID=363840 RepID=A0ABU1JW49_9PROT|nr:hypothetical protein [Inquilinus ginsengisoli]MDR6292843.1 hypothetical protein [Inquilinus ginsengisoli]